MLCGEDAVHRFDRQQPPLAQKIGEVRLAEAGLSGQQRDAERAPLHSTQQFEAKPFLHLGYIHVENLPPAMGTTVPGFLRAKLSGVNCPYFQRFYKD